MRGPVFPIAETAVSAMIFAVMFFAVATRPLAVGLAARQLIGDFATVAAIIVIAAFTAFGSLRVPVGCVAFRPLRPPWRDARFHRIRSLLWVSGAW